MQTLAVISRKGGVGKTTLAVNLATAAHEAGLRTVLADLDSQHSALAWAERRRRTGPSVIETTAGKLFPLWSALINARCQLMILDTPSGGEAETLQALRLADMCLLVCRPNYFDLTALERSVEQLRQFERPGLIVLNQAPPQRMGQESEAVRDAVATLSRMGLPLARIGLRHRTIFPSSAARGLAAHELAPQSAAAREIGGVWAQVRDMLGVVHAEFPTTGLRHPASGRAPSREGPSEQPQAGA